MTAGLTVVLGIPGVTAALDQKSKQIMAAVAIGVNRGAEIARTDIIAKLQKGGRSGREYKRGGVTHIASKPGEPPATDLGQLVKSIRVVSGKPSTLVTAKVVARAPYAMALEYGTKNLEPRPFMQPNDKVVQLIARALYDAVEKAVLE